MYTKSQLLSQLNDPKSPLIVSIQDQYSDPQILKNKIARIKKLLEHPQLNLHQETIISRCPGRISLSKHADYINNDLLYILDDRDIYLACQTNQDRKIRLINLDESYQDQELSLDHPSLIDCKKEWFYYPVKLIEKLIDNNLSSGLTLVYDSDLPAAGGLSSSHALMLSTFITLVEILSLDRFQQALTTRVTSDAKIFEIIKLCQAIEHERGFSSGLGDQSAQLLCKKDQFSFIKLMPELNIEYRNIPSDLAIITAPSFINADKSLPEFQAANDNIKIYKQINNLSHKYNCDFLGDLLYKFSEKEIFSILETLEDRSLRGLALYGLAEGARVKELKKHLDIQTIGKHLNLSHQAEKNYYYDTKVQDWQAISQDKQLNYKFNPQESISSHSGIYLASTIANDQLQYAANNIDGVYGSSISGAGLGGNNTIICDKKKVEIIRKQLIESFYRERGLEQEALEKVHISSSSAAAGRII